MRRPHWWVAAATLVCVGGWAVLGFAIFGPAGLDDGWKFGWNLLALVPLGLGWLIAIRAPTSPVAAALALLAASMVATPAVESWGETSATDAAWWGSGPTAVLGASVWPWQMVGFMTLLLVFPSGRLPGPRWAMIAALVPLSPLILTVARVLTMNHYDVPPARSPVSVPQAVWMPVLFSALGLFLLTVIACGAGVVVRYRRGNEQTRQQLRWLIFAAGLVVVLMVASWVVTALGWMGPVAHIGFLFGVVVLVPVAVAVAVLRHDLFEIDRVLSDSVAWALTTVVAAAIFATSAVVLGYVVGRDSPLGLSGAVFLAAATLLPVYRRVHDATGRVFDRERTVILAQIRDFVDRVREGADEPESVQDVLRHAVGAPDLVLLLTAAHRGGYVDITGHETVPATDAVVVPLRTAGADIGVVVTSNASARQLRRVKLAASAARLPIEVSRLRLGLHKALGEVSASRQRLVTAAVAERKRLERDLHDGAQQQIVAVGMQLRAAQRQLPPDHPVVDQLDQAVEHLEHTVAELRRLAHGVRPVSLDDGLPTALRRLAAGCTLPVDFDVTDAAAPETVTTTAYFVVAEALTNVLKHAHATKMRIQVRQIDNHLQVLVTDDGVGGATSEFRLTTLRDRVSAIGGWVSVTSAPHAGTTIEAVMPCGS